jgi:hypothetical protein
MSAIERLLGRLGGVKQVGPHSFMARCPAHEDGSPSLSVREKEGGRTLIYCFAGCGAGEILEAVGLRMSDLFDQPIVHHLPPIRGGFNARELLELSAHEICVAALLTTKAADQKLTEEEVRRLRAAAARLGKAQDLMHGR